MLGLEPRLEAGAEADNKAWFDGVFNKSKMLPLEEARLRLKSNGR